MKVAWPHLNVTLYVHRVSYFICLMHIAVRALFKKYRTFGRQKYNYLLGCLKP